MKRIFLSLSTLILVGAAVAGGTGAFFSDTETSSGNTFTAGAIDLKIDNTSYYNGVFSPNTSWALADLTIQKFFNFIDLKPGDRGEDTISLHVNTNDAYLCANVKLTSNDDNGLNEPEALVDSTGDDGDNVLESNENVISQGPIGALGLGGSMPIALADSQNNIWTGVGGAAPGATTLYIGKAWCFGTIGIAKLDQDTLGLNSPRTPANSTGGITCDGSTLNNSTQTDSLTADVTFNATQARNNPGFLCVPPKPKGKLTVTKVVVNNNGGNNVVGDFSLFVDDGFVPTQVTSGVQNTLPVGTYNVSEAGATGYQASFSGDCDGAGDVVINANDVKTCTITNTELPAHITLYKNVTGTTTLESVTTYGLKVDGIGVPHGASIAVTSNAPHTISETGKVGYTFVSIIGSPECPAVLNGTATLDEGEAITCIITNHKNPI
jgi:predicted ribosomally synthesized peptide with SipW-like signal peptide